MNFNNALRNITAVVAFGVFGIAISPGAAHAGAMYSADASVAITFTGITGGILGQDGVSVSYESKLTKPVDATGGGQTNFSSWPGSPAIPMELDPLGNNELNQNQFAFGGAGSALETPSSSVQSQGLITMFNGSDNPVDFLFAYSIQAAPSVDATGNAVSKDAFAESNIQIFDQTSAFVNILKDLTANLTTGVTSPALNTSGTFRIQVSAKDSNKLSVLVDTHGSASFIPLTVPEPETLTLLIAGLLLGITARLRAPTVSTKGISPAQSLG